VCWCGIVVIVNYCNYNLNVLNFVKILNVLFVLSMFSKLMSQASQFAMEGVKNLVVKKHVSCYPHVYIGSQIFKDYISTSYFIFLLPKIVGLCLQNSGIG